MKTLYSLIGAVRELAAEENTGLKRKMARHYKDALQQILLVWLNQEEIGKTCGMYAVMTKTHKILVGKSQ